MRLVVGVLACIGAGVLTVAVADPPEQPVHAASSPSTIAPAAQAPAAPQSDRVAPAVTKPPIDPQEKRLIAHGYKPQMRHGQKVLRRPEQPLRPRLGHATRCARA